MEEDWSVYILRCADKSLYTGVTNNLNKRVETHNSSPAGAKYTKARRPVVLVYHEDSLSRSDAQKREFFIKKMTRAEKLSMIQTVDKK